MALDIGTKIGSPLAFSKRGCSLIGQEMFKVLDRARELEEEGIRVYHLELGNPRLRPPREILDATIASIQQLDLGYTPSAGIPELRRALAERYRSRVGRSINEGNIVISPANFLINQFLELTCDPGDRVVMLTPAFPTYLAATAHMGLDVVDVPLDLDHGFDLTELKIHEALSAHPKAILVNSANNPTGTVYRQEVLARLAARCEEEGIWLLSDETYAELCYDRPFYSLAALDLPQLVVISSFSKIFSIPGFRVGYAIAQQAVAEKLALSSSTLMSCLPAFTQWGCLAGVHVMEQYVAQVRESFARNAAACSQLINESGVLCCTPPQSGFYIFLDISATKLTDLEFAHRLLQEHHTAVTPGRSFGSAYTTFIRIAICGKLEDVREGITRVLALARSCVESR